MKKVSLISAASLLATGCTTQPQMDYKAIEQLNDYRDNHTVQVDQSAATDYDSLLPSTLIDTIPVAESLSEQEVKVKLELYTRADNETTNTQLNFFHPHFKGGIGQFSTEDGDLSYASGVVSVDDARFIFRGISDQKGDRDSYLLQGAYDFDGLNIGGGVTHQEDDTYYGRILHTGTISGLDYLFGGQVKITQKESTSGVVGFLYAEDIEESGLDLAAGMQWDNNQKRYTGGVVLPPLTEKIRPGVDVLYVENANGSSLFLGNATLGYQGRFYVKDSKIGRLLGPTGIWAPNPIFGADSALRPHLNYNRLGNPWLIGDIANVQYLQLETPDGDVKTRMEVLVHPFQFSNDNILDISGFPADLFFGYSIYDTFSDEKRDGPLFGGRFKNGSFMITIYDDKVVGSVNLSFRH